MNCLYYLFALLLFPEVPSEKQFKLRKSQKITPPREFSRDVPMTRNNRRQIDFLKFGDMKDREKHHFYQPYEPMGDFVFLRTTPPPTKKGDLGEPPKEAPPNTADVNSYFISKIEAYRGCNFVCPELFRKYGMVCGWVKYKWNDDFVEYDYPRNYWTGHHEYIEYRNFDSICDMLTANCRDMLVTGVTRPESTKAHWYPPHYHRYVWRLAHLGECDENTEKSDNFWKVYENLREPNMAPHIWQRDTEELMKTYLPSEKNWATYKTTPWVTRAGGSNFLLEGGGHGLPPKAMGPPPIGR